MGLLVGEHDITKGGETPYTVLLRISAFAKHPKFNKDTNANDIALIRTQNSIAFTRGGSFSQ
jgi:Trypsin